MARTQPPDRSDDLWDDLDEFDDLGFVEPETRAADQRRVPWYQSGPAVAALAAITLAVIAIAVSMTLLSAINSDDSTPDTVKPTMTKTPASPAPSSEPETTPTTASSSAPRPAPPTPAETKEETSAEPPPPATRPTDDGPEINVTRTPVTRSPISVAPSRRSP